MSIYLSLVAHYAGYSSKIKDRKHEDVIGQFGEGLKVGALALVRDGRIVTMETRNEHWRFELNLDPNFGVKVLTVHVTGALMYEHRPVFSVISNVKLILKMQCKSIELKCGVIIKVEVRGEYWS